METKKLTRIGFAVNKKEMEIVVLALCRAWERGELSTELLEKVRSQVADCFPVFYND